MRAGHRAETRQTLLFDFFLSFFLFPSFFSFSLLFCYFAFFRFLCSSFFLFSFLVGGIHVLCELVGLILLVECWTDWTLRSMARCENGDGRRVGIVYTVDVMTNLRSSTDRLTDRAHVVLWFERCFE